MARITAGSTEELTKMLHDIKQIPGVSLTRTYVLLMGPLYSITEYEERILAVKESCRLLKDDGLLFSEP